MATVRKYKPPKGYKDGGAVPIDDVVAGPPAEPAPAPPPPAAEDSPLLKALAAQTRAEELQRQAAPPPPHDPIAALPISDFKKNLLRQHPELLGDFESKALAFHYQAALNDGVADDSPELAARLLDGVQRERQHLHQRATENVMRAAPPLMPQPPRPQPTAAPVLPEPPMMPPPSRRMPISAPVSREVPSATGKRLSDSKVTLSPEERMIARNSWVDDPNNPVSDAVKEMTYARNKLRLKRMRETGEYRRTTEETG
jgi:hypothetical protein